MFVLVFSKFGGSVWISLFALASLKGIEIERTQSKPSAYKRPEQGLWVPQCPRSCLGSQSCHVRWHLCCRHKIFFSPNRIGSLFKTISVLSKANKCALRILNSMQDHLSKVHRGLEALGSATDASGLFRSI